jgi:hypothetical protein
MARYTSVIANDTSGKIGDIVMAHWNGKKIIRSYCPHYNQTKVTDAQKTQRNKFAPLRRFAFANIDLANEIFTISPQYIGRKESFLKWLLDITNTSAVIDILKCNYTKVGNGSLPLIGVLQADNLSIAPNILLILQNSNLLPAAADKIDGGDTLLINYAATKIEIQFDTVYSSGAEADVANTGLFNISEKIICLTRYKTTTTNPVNGNVIIRYSPFSINCPGYSTNFT